MTEITLKIPSAALKALLALTKDVHGDTDEERLTHLFIDFAAKGGRASESGSELFYPQSTPWGIGTGFPPHGGTQVVC